MFATPSPSNRTSRRTAPILAAFAFLAWAAPSPGEGPDPRLSGYRTPPGWKVEIAASEPLVINPVTMTFGVDGRLYVVEWLEGGGPNDRIKVLTDVDADGTFDKAEIYMDRLELPAGIAFWDGWTYITLGHDLVRFQDRDGDGRFETRESVATGFGNDNSHHRVSGISVGPDGWLYLTTGDSDAHARGSDGSEATVLRCGGVFRCRPDGSHMEVVAMGMRNPWGNVAFDDEFQVFHTDNDNEGSPGFTGCRLLHVVEGGDYGWRLREGARCCAPDFERATWNGGRPGRLGWIAETGRGAPAGLCVLNSAAFPPSTRNLLVYPDVFRKLVRAYKLKPAGATYTVAEEIPLLASDEGLFRPTDAEVGTDGALYILDWRTDSGGAGQLSGNGKTGRIYRMTWSGTADEPARPTLPRDRLVEILRGETATLLSALKSDDYGMRLAAGRELIRRGRGSVPAAQEIGRALATSRDEPAVVRRHLAAVAAGLDPGDERFRLARLAFWIQHVVAPPPADPVLARIGLESLGRLEGDDQAVVAPLLMARQSGPRLVRAQAYALGRLDRLPRKRGGATVDDRKFLEEIRAALLRASLEGGRSVEDARRFLLGHADSLSVDMVVAELLALADESKGADPFLRDAITRGLDRLGPPAVEALVEAFSSGDATRSEVALFTLQGWRGREALSAVLSAATSKDEVPASARVGLFRTLREMVNDLPPDRIAEWLIQAPGAPSEARAEAIRVLSAMHGRALLAAAPALPALLNDPSPEVRRAALALAGEIRSKEAESGLLALASATDRPADERRLALSALRSYEDKALAPSLSGLFNSSADAGFRTELLRTLASIDFAAASEHARAMLADKDGAPRQEAIALLGQKPQTALAVALLYNQGKLPAEDLPRVIEAVRQHATPELQAAMQALLRKTLLAAPTGAEARRLREYVARHGNPSRGKALYLDAKKAGCATCHRMEGVGGSVGPDLTRVYETLSFDKRVESILEPSKEIKEGFGTYKVATADGRVVTGLLLSESPEAVTLRDAQGREVRVPSREIEEKGFEKSSLMPEGVVGHLSFNEFSDLLAFLGDRQAQESLKTLGNR